MYCVFFQSWVVEEKSGSVDGLPIQRVVKKAVNSVKNKKAATMVLTKKKVAKSDKKKTIVNVEKVEKPKPEMKKTVVKVEKVDSPKPEKKKSVAAPTTKTFDDDVVDVTDKVNADNLKMASSSEETFSNPLDQMANKATADALRALQDGLDNLDSVTSKSRRVPQLAGSQKYPYEGNSTVKRIITDVPSSSSVPEHLQPVSDDQFDRLKDWLEPDLEYYEVQVNGTAQCEAATNKKWFVDVDHLYAFLFVNGNHWVALDIDLTKKRINVYDSISSLTTDTEMAIQCMFVMTMIVAMLSSFVPSKQRRQCRRSYSKLEWKRITKSLRTKLAVEMFEELRENAGTLHSEVRRKAFKFPSLMDE
ncbi:hypothetical protein AXX17_AT5G30910 [Arabidopsis thaliana]|uniref:Ubiquitin-like protease family profile domain-containing protein n=1 Tax=Arabidopsis thaliana TaxID=3702 RepID=A0A178UFZ0_ARATH|nr:hypothetical protein AXX17_AT5G30910 [Arabidopsis thaliana]